MHRECSMPWDHRFLRWNKEVPKFFTQIPNHRKTWWANRRLAAGLSV